MKKIIRNGLIGLMAINLILVFTGMVIPYVISTRDMPLIGIIFTITCIVSFVFTIGYCIGCKWMDKNNDGQGVAIGEGSIALGGKGGGNCRGEECIITSENVMMSGSGGGANHDNYRDYSRNRINNLFTKAAKEGLTPSEKVELHSFMTQKDKK